MPRTGRSEYRYKGKTYPQEFTSAVVTLVSFSLDLPDPRFASTIHLKVVQKADGRYLGRYEYGEGPYRGYKGTLDLERKDYADGGHTFRGRYLEEAREGHAAYEDSWEFTIDPPED